MELASLFEALSSLLVIFLLAVHIIKSFLSEVFQLEGNLDDLTKVHAGGSLARWVIELIVYLKLILDKVLHSV